MEATVEDVCKVSIKEEKITCQLRWINITNHH